MNYLGEKRNFNVYQADKMLRRAIEREFEIIGEVLNRIEKLDSSINSSSKKQIISMKHRVIHGYDKIDNEIIWDTIVTIVRYKKRFFERKVAKMQSRK